MNPIALATLALLGCSGSSFECDETTACPGLGEICQSGQCVQFRCATSAQCPMESYCLSGDCLPGCTEDYDCKTGFHCELDAMTCAQDVCESTNVDCSFGEFCNTATGECYDATGQYCHFCNEHDECGDGNYCFGHYCGVDCSSGNECPQGFTCYGITDGTANIIAYQCLGPCWMYEDLPPETF